MLVSKGTKQSGVIMPMKLNSVPYRHSSIRIFCPASPNLEFSITSSIQSKASCLFSVTRTPLPAANPSALSTIGKLILLRYSFATLASLKNLASPVGILFSNINSFE